MADAQCLCELQKRHDRWITPAPLQAANVLLAEPRALLDLLLGQALVLTDAGKVSAHQLAHVHAHSDGGLWTLSLSTIVCISLPNPCRTKGLAAITQFE
jgi:hypothetical protein